MNILSKLKNGILLAVIFLAFQVSMVKAQATVKITVHGPIAADAPGTSLNSIYSASGMDLEANGYMEEEYFIDGLANRYTYPPNQDAAIIDSGHTYRTRFIVRRPKRKADFKGVVIVEWINVTGGPDKDINWWMSGDHFMRRGYAYIGISAQQMGINTMKEWSPQRYGSLEITDKGKVERDDLSYDIFSDIGLLVLRKGETAGQDKIDILGGLRADYIIATGHSQSANRLSIYINHVHPLSHVYDGFMVHGGGWGIRKDSKDKVFKIMAESDMIYQAVMRQPNTETFHQWEVAGTSHVDLQFEIEYAKVRNLRDGMSGAKVVPRIPECDLPAHSRIPFRDVLNAAYEHLVSWVKDNKIPPYAEPLSVLSTEPKLVLGRDEYGNILGGIRLANHVVATAKNTGMNWGANQFCWLYGSHEPFDEQTIKRLYPTHQDYVRAVKKGVRQNLTDGFILPFAAKRTIREAEASNIGR